MKKVLLMTLMAAAALSLSVSTGCRRDTGNDGGDTTLVFGGDTVASGVWDTDTLPSGIEGLDIHQTSMRDAFFEYDSSELNQLAMDALMFDAAYMMSNDGFKLLIEGHCDERGSAEYNLGLGDRRATAARDFLVQLGVPTDRLKTVSYGKERPQCTESDESCWQKNRRIHFSPGQ